jgi:hypothetical protein
MAGNWQSLAAATMADRVEDFVDCASREALAQKVPDQIILDDPHGNIGTERFRRSLAWHIGRRPGGLVALAIQYGHLRTSVPAGYASRSRDGIHDLLDVETARPPSTPSPTCTMTSKAAAESPAPQPGERSTPQSRCPQYASAIINAKQARKYLANPYLNVYENPNTLLMCIYRRDKALCRLGSSTAPARCRRQTWHQTPSIRSPSTIRYVGPCHVMTARYRLPLGHPCRAHPAATLVGARI